MVDFPPCRKDGKNVVSGAQWTYVINVCEHLLGRNCHEQYNNQSYQPD